MAMSTETKLRRAVARRDAAIAKAEAELQATVIAGFDEGMSGPRVAELLGVSVPRAYQYRDGRR